MEWPFSQEWQGGADDRSGAHIYVHIPTYLEQVSDQGEEMLQVLEKGHF